MEHPRFVSGGERDNARERETAHPLPLPPTHPPTSPPQHSLTHLTAHAPSPPTPYIKVGSVNAQEDGLFAAVRAIDDADVPAKRLFVRRWRGESVKCSRSVSLMWR